MMKKPMPFAGKESKREELMEKKMPAKKYMAGEKREAERVGYANGGLVVAGYGAPNECTYNQGPGVRSRQDYKK